MNVAKLPPAFEISRQPFQVRQQTIDRISLAMSVYILLVLYPAYELIRWMWADSSPSLSSVGIALLIAILFGPFARNTISRYMVNIR